MRPQMSCSFFGGGHGNESALTMPEQPYAGRTRALPDDRNPSAHVRHIVGDSDGIAVQRRTNAAGHAALVDAHRRYPLFDQAFSQETVGRCGYSTPTVAVTVGSTRAWDDEYHGTAPRGWAKHGASQRAGWTRRFDESLYGCRTRGSDNTGK